MTKNNMVKASCCVPRWTNNWRISPLVTLVFCHSKFWQCRSPKPTPACFASTDSTHSPARRKNGTWRRPLNETNILKISLGIYNRIAFRNTVQLFCEIEATSRSCNLIGFFSLFFVYKIKTCQLSRFCRESHDFFVISHGHTARLPISRVLGENHSEMK